MIRGGFLGYEDRYEEEKAPASEGGLYNGLLARVFRFHGGDHGTTRTVTTREIARRIPVRRADTSSRDPGAANDRWNSRLPLHA
jgi:hypothetical protein